MLGVLARICSPKVLERFDVNADTEKLWISIDLGSGGTGASKHLAAAKV
jgi:hypothetical protein